MAACSWSSLTALAGSGRSSHGGACSRTSIVAPVESRGIVTDSVSYRGAPRQRKDGGGRGVCRQRFAAGPGDAELGGAASEASRPRDLLPTRRLLREVGARGSPGAGNKPRF